MKPGLAGFTVGLASVVMANADLLPIISVVVTTSHPAYLRDHQLLSSVPAFTPRNELED